MSDQLKLIKCNSHGVNRPDDPTFPFRLDAEFSAPEFMQVAFCMMHGGTETLSVRGMTQEAIQEFVAKNGFDTHPRLIRMAITKPETNETIRVYKGLWDKK